jgi:hypothetical protein
LRASGERNLERLDVMLGCGLSTRPRRVAGTAHADEPAPNPLDLEFGASGDVECRDRRPPGVGLHRVAWRRSAHGAQFARARRASASRETPGVCSKPWRSRPPS